MRRRLLLWGVACDIGIAMRRHLLYWYEASPVILVLLWGVTCYIGIGMRRRLLYWYWYEASPVAMRCRLLLWGVACCYEASPVILVLATLSHWSSPWMTALISCVRYSSRSHWDAKDMKDSPFTRIPSNIFTYIWQKQHKNKVFFSQFSFLVCIDLHTYEPQP